MVYNINRAHACGGEMRKVRKVHATICLQFYIGFFFNSCYVTLKISSIVYILFQTFVAQKFGKTHRQIA